MQLSHHSSHDAGTAAAVLLTYCGLVNLMSSLLLYVALKLLISRPRGWELIYFLCLHVSEALLFCRLRGSLESCWTQSTALQHGRWQCRVLLSRAGEQMASNRVCACCTAEACMGCMA